MQIYTVGGYVRDMLLRRLGRPVSEGGDRDWVVVGATPELMVSRGFKPVGADFPVFLHPQTHEEYALARTERKTAPGYHGFVFHAAADVTLEEDLRRRDLTVNAIAMVEDGTLIDPYGGEKDLENGILRHVSEAFCEDPVRILRVARFAARFPGFVVADETMALMKDMVNCGEADALVAERVWAEMIRALAAPAPIRFVDTLIECGLWQKLFPGLALPAAPLRRALSEAAEAGLSAEARFALLLSSAEPAAAKKYALALRASSEAQQLAESYCRLKPLFDAPRTVANAAALLNTGDALRRRERMLTVIAMRELLSGVREIPLRQALESWCGINAGEIAKAQTNPKQIPAAVLQARTQAIAPYFE